MALLNFALTYEEVSGRLQLPESNSGQYVELVFTKDGHIITHGTDYTPTFSAGKRGLVPGSTGKQTEFLRGNGKWLSITTSDLPIATSISDAISNQTTNTTILTTQQVIEYVSSNMSASDSMVYKGTISYSGGVYTTNTVDGQDIEGFPTKCKVGDTYRVTSNGTYGGQVCSNGDLIICIKDGSGSSLNTAEYWTAVEANINGSTTHKVNNTSYSVYTSNPSSSFTIYAPTTGGTSGYILKSNGSTAAPTWVSQSSITAGGLTDTAKKGLLTSVSLGSNGAVSVTVGGTTKTSSAASGTWGISITGQAARVANALSTGAGLTMGMTSATPNTYNGSAARTIQLVPATASTIGGVIVDKDSENKTISVTEDGSIFLTQQNIINALGYTPGSSADNKVYTTIIASSASSTTAVSQATANPYINLIQTQGSAKTVAGTFRLSGSGRLSVTGQTQVTLSLGAADSTNYGGIKIGYPTSGKNYAVQLSDGKAFVNVPWTNTTYELATDSTNGLVPAFDAVGTGSLVAGSWVLAKLANGTYDWFALPSTVFSDNNTWRAIQVNGTQLLSTSTGSGPVNFVGGGHTSISGSGSKITITSSWRDITIGGSSIGSKTLNFLPTGDIYIKADSNGDDIQDLSFGLSWYNLSTEEYEIA